MSPRRSARWVHRRPGALPVAPTPPPGDSLDWLCADSAMGALIRSMDWSTTPLGPIGAWPQSLRTVVSVCLASNFPICLVWGPELIQIYNDGYQPICGAKHPGAMGQSFHTCWASTWPDIGDPFARALAGKAQFLENQRMFLDRNGYLEETWFTSSFSPIRDETGAISGIFHPVTETTARMLSERRVRALRDVGARSGEAQTTDEACARIAMTLADYAEDLPFVLLYLVDEDGARARLAGVTGLEPGTAQSPLNVDLRALEGSGWPLARVMAQRRPERVDALESWFSALRCGPYPEPPPAALVIPLQPPGFERPLGILVAGVSARLALDDAYRAFHEMLANAITAAVSGARAYQETRQRADALAELDRVKTTFFSNISHELRTPLTLILGPVEDSLSEAADPLQPQLRQRQETIHRNALRLLKLVNTLLDFARIEAGRVQASFEPLDLAALTADLASNFRSAIEEAGLRLVIDASPSPADVYVDREMWEKIVLNLVSNALKFTFAGEIQVSLRATGEHVVLAVRDTGTGIPKEELTRVFERFHRVENARSRTHEGTGIGLALVHELVRLHGGTIRAESEAGRGTTVTVTIPRGKAHLPADRVRAPRASTSTAIGAAPFVDEARRWLPVAPREHGHRSLNGSAELRAAPDEEAGQRSRILVVDDNADMRAYVTGLLEQRWSVTAVADGTEALRVACERPPELVLSDVMMPGLNGFELLRALREDARTKTIPIILLSARAGEEATIEGLLAGADDYLIKPFSARELVARVRTTLALSRLRHELEEKQAELLALGEDRLRLAMEATGLGIWEMDLETQKITCNERCSAMLGLPPGRPRDYTDFFPALATDDDRRLVHAAVQRALDPAGDGDYAVEFRIQGLQGGGERCLAARGHVIVDAERPRRFLGTILDVTERAELMAREQKARATAEEANRLKDEFLATISHELRTPLTAITGWAEMLRGVPPSAAMLARGIDVIARNAAAQKAIIEDILDVSRIITGHLRIEQEVIDLDAVVRDAIDVVMPSAVAKSIDVGYRSASGPWRLIGDPSRLRQIVWNLLSNAVKFTPSGGRVDVALGRAEGVVRLQVADTGEGIAATLLPHVFDRFRQGDSSTTRRHGGLGLGLSIVRHLVELHGGEVRAESPGRGRGATLTIDLPLRAIAAEPSRGRENGGLKAPPAPAPERVLEGVRVLVVDDEEDARALIEDHLADYGAVVATAGSAVEAMQMLAHFHPDVLVSDIGLPGGDAVAMIRQIRAMSDACGRIPAIVLSACARPQDSQRALSAGYLKHLPKPIDGAALARAVVEARAG
jgi:PAS domain S-box-containing protein